MSVGEAQRLAQSAKVGEILRRQEESGRWVGAICAAPIALQAHGVFQNRQLTSHPSVKGMLEDWGEYSEHPVVADGNLITSRGPGTAFPFALRIVGALTDAQRMVEVRAPMMFPVQVYHSLPYHHVLFVHCKDLFICGQRDWAANNSSSGFYSLYDLFG